MLKRFARDIEREVLAVHHAANEVEVIGQQLLAFLHDEHVRRIECEPLLVILAVEVVGRMTWDEEQRVVGKRAFGVDRDRAQRIGIVVEIRLVEFVVFLFAHL